VVDTKFKALKLRIISLLIVLGFFIGIAVSYINGVYRGRPYPWNTFLDIPASFMSDFEGDMAHIEHMDPFHAKYHGYYGNYPPFAYLSTIPFSFWGIEIGRVLTIAFICIGLWIFLWSEFRLRTDSAGLNFLILPIIGLMNYPLLFEIDRLNAEGLAFVWLACFWVFFRKKKYPLSAAFLGAATAAKIYPGLFILLFFCDKRWRDVGVWFLSCALLTVLSLVVFRTSPQEALRMYGMAAQLLQPFMHGWSFLYQHSVGWLGLIKAIQYYNWREYVENVALSNQTNDIYYYAIIPFVIITIMAVLSRFTDLWEKASLICLAILLFPTVSFDYKLLHLFIPIAAFLNGATDKRESILFSILFGLMLIPKGLGHPIVSDSTTQVISNPIILTVIWALLLRSAWKRYKSPPPQNAKLATA